MGEIRGFSAVMERVKGIEPSYSAWEAAALPLSYTRIAMLPIQATGIWQAGATKFLGGDQPKIDWPSVIVLPLVTITRSPSFVAANSFLAKPGGTPIQPWVALP